MLDETDWNGATPSSISTALWPKLPYSVAFLDQYRAAQRREASGLRSGCGRGWKRFALPDDLMMRKLLWCMAPWPIRAGLTRPWIRMIAPRVSAIWAIRES